MADITITFADGTSHVYENVPNDVTREQAIQRAARDFAGKQISNVSRASFAEMSPVDVAGRAVANLPGSTAKLVGDLFTAITSPVQTAKGILDIGAGALQNILPTSVKEFVDRFDANPQAAQRAVQVANAVGGEYKQKYGTMEGFKKALATDPANVLADLSTIMTGGAAVASRAAPVGAAAVRQAASFVDPLSLAAKTVSGGAQVAQQAVPAILGARVGAGQEAVSQAFQAGKKGGAEATQFRQNIRGQADMLDALEAARGNLEAIRKQRGDIYRASMENIKGDKTVLSFDGIDKALNKAYEDFTFKGKPKNDLAIQKLNEAKAKIDEWKTYDPAEFHTPEGMDALKQQVGQIIEDLKPRTPSDTAVKGIYGAIKNEINAQAPTYAKTMKAYSDATDQILEIQQALSIKDKTSADTAMRKLQSIMRNNVNTNFGQRLSLAKELEQAGGQMMLPALAGQALSSITPRGLQSATAPLEAATMFGLGGGPAALISAATSSPRLVGEAAFAAGQAAAVPGRVGRGLLDLEQRLPTELQITPRAAGMQMPEIDFRTLNLLYQLRQREEENQ
jgi:hypothetical protein